MTKKDRKDLFFGLYNHINTKIYSYLYVVVHNRDDAEDLLQEVASLLWEKFDRFEEGTNFEAWAIAIARNKALEFLRKNKKSRMIFDSQYYELISKHALKTARAVPDRMEAMRECVKKLPEKDGNLLSMRFVENVTVKQISVRIGRSSSSICQSLTRIVNILRLCITKTLNRQGY